MLRFFAGLTLAQLLIALLVHLSPLTNTLENGMLVLFVIFLLSSVITLWFNTVSRHQADQRIAAMKEKFASEKEKINVSAERAQKKLLKKTQKEIESERRKQNTRANIKIGGAVAVAAGFGVVMLMSQFFTLGLLTLTTAGGAVGGYLARTRREQLPGPEYKMIEGVEVLDETKKLADNSNDLESANSSSIDSDNETPDTTGPESRND